MNSILSKLRQTYTLVFMKGIDELGVSNLNVEQQKKMLNLINKDKSGNSFMVHNPEYVNMRIKEWKRQLSWITPYYALKSNPNIKMIKDIIQGEYGGFDCASQNEISLVLENGGDLNRIIYSNPIKNISDLVYANEQGINITVADTLDELLKIKKYAPQMEILWRLNIKGGDVDPYFSNFSDKFGDDIESDSEIYRRLVEIKDLGVCLKGIHFHCGSGVYGGNTFAQAIQLSKKCIKIGKELGHQMDLLDVGGGFPDGNLTEDFVQCLHQTKNEQFMTIAEPGRYFSAHSSYLLFRIIGKRIKNNQQCYIVNESMFHAFNVIQSNYYSFDGQQDQVYSVQGEQTQWNNNNNNNNNNNCTLLGMTCDSKDILARNIKMPQNLNENDWICMSGMGAYTVGLGSQFNGMQSLTRYEIL